MSLKLLLMFMRGCKVINTSRVKGRRANRERVEVEKGQFIIPRRLFVQKRQNGSTANIKLFLKKVFKVNLDIHRGSDMDRRG